MYQPERTALLDLNLTFGHAAAWLGLHPETSLAGVPTESLANFDRRTLGHYLLEHGSGLQVLVAGTRPEEGEVVTAGHVRAALGTMKRQFSSVFVDCASSFDEPTLAALETADTIILVCTAELSTLRDVRECLRVFGEIIHLDLRRVCLVFNHNQPFAVLARDQFESALEQPMAFEVPHAGEAAFRASGRGEPLVRLNANSAFSKAIDKLVRALVPAEPRSTLKRAARAAPPSTSGVRAGGGQPGLAGLFDTLRGKRGG
jgi:pilus assembly protein CpaE